MKVGDRVIIDYKNNKIEAKIVECALPVHPDSVVSEPHYKVTFPTFWGTKTKWINEYYIKAIRSAK
jgi:hypothetical protein